MSSRGWALGYLGGGLLLAADLALVTLLPFGLSTGDALRISLFTAGLWWGLWTIVPLRGLVDRPVLAGGQTAGRTLRRAFGQLATTLRHGRAYPNTLLFLAAYLFYNDGIQTVIAAASIYGSRALGLAESTLIAAILLVQFVAFGGALLLGRLARRYGSKRVIAVSLGIWTVVVAAAYTLPAGRVTPFLLLAVAIGLVLGGSQALSRSLFSQLIPPGKEAEYFGFYEISDRGTSWLGPFLFALTFDLTGSYRYAIFSLVFFFVVGGFLLARLDMRQAIVEAGNAPPERV